MGDDSILSTRNPSPLRANQMRTVSGSRRCYSTRGHEFSQPEFDCLLPGKSQQEARDVCGAEAAVDIDVGSFAHRCDLLSK